MRWELSFHSIRVASTNTRNLISKDEKSEGRTSSSSGFRGTNVLRSTLHGSVAVVVYTAGVLHAKSDHIHVSIYYFLSLSLSRYQSLHLFYPPFFPFPTFPFSFFSPTFLVLPLSFLFSPALYLVH